MELDKFRHGVDPYLDDRADESPPPYWGAGCLDES